MTHINAKATPINDNDYNNYRTCLLIVWSLYHATSRHWLLIALGGGHTHAQTHIQTIRTGSILRNQAWKARAWFKNKVVLS